MAGKKHGSLLELTIDGDELSDWTDTCEFAQSKDVHQTTTHGSAATSGAHANSGGLNKGECTAGGLYENGAAGPNAILGPLVKSKASVALVRKVEGTGSGLPQDTVNVVVEEYKETSPVADYIRWTAKFTFDGAVTTIAQSA